MLEVAYEPPGRGAAGLHRHRRVARDGRAAGARARLRRRRSARGRRSSTASTPAAPTGPFTYREGKAEAIRELAAREGIDLADSYAYSRLGVRPADAARGRPPGRGQPRRDAAAQVAREEGWDVMRFERLGRRLKVVAAARRDGRASAASAARSPPAASRPADIAAADKWYVRRPLGLAGPSKGRGREGPWPNEDGEGDRVSRSLPNRAMHAVFGRINKRRSGTRCRRRSLKALNLLSLRLDLRDLNLFDTSARRSEDGASEEPPPEALHARRPDGTLERPATTPRWARSRAPFTRNIDPKRSSPRSRRACTTRARARSRSS